MFIFFILIFLLICICNEKRECFKETIITFIIPSIGRDTIFRTIKSLQNMNNPNWKAIIIFDGVKSNIKSIKDHRIKYYEIEKSGFSNMGGAPRNFGIKKVKNSSWIGFVDDDDTLSPNYIDMLNEESKKNIDCIIFRMANTASWMSIHNYVLPRLNEKSIYRNRVGISFCVKTQILKNNLFINSKTEDFDLLYKLSKIKYKLLLSKHVAYFVNMKPNKYYSNIKGDEVINPVVIP